MTQRRPPPIDWIDEDSLWMMIARSLDTATVADVDPYVKAAKASGQISTQNGKYRRSDARNWLKSLEPIKIAGAKKGRKAHYDWDKAWAFICRSVHDDGLPDKQIELEKKIRHWFRETYNEVPAKSLIEEKVKQLYKAMKQEPGN